MLASAGSGSLLDNVAAFGRVLRAGGLEVGPRRLQTAVRALDAMGLGSREAVYWTLSCALVSRREEAATFDAAFSAFWDRLLPPSASAEEPPLAREQAVLSAADAPDAAELGVGDTPAAGEDGEPSGEVESGVAWSAQERLRHLDFSRYGAAELDAARALMQRIARAAPLRRSRRFRATTSGREMDQRRTMRSAMRTEGHPLQRAWREPRHVARRLIFLIDVSGSMEAYARPLVLFAQVVLRTAPKVEVFTFGTRLTRITAELADRDAVRALRTAGQVIPDWAGGTRIGDNLAAFNDTAGRRALTRGAVVVIVSDGCERGDSQRLASEMVRLQRAAHAVVWVNPLAGDPRYEPRTQGMVAALPSIDVLLAGNDLAALESLAAILEAIPARRPRRPTPA